MADEEAMDQIESNESGDEGDEMQDDNTESILDTIETPSSSRRRSHLRPLKRNPARLRKPNPRIFGDPDDPLFTSYPSYKRKSKMKDDRNQSVRDTIGYHTRSSGSSKSIANKNASRLRNLLKLPKASRWVYCEFFYSTIDHSLFKGENDFLICMQECFPYLNLNKLTRSQWVMMRRMLGKPRRCSPAFFDEERSALHMRRVKVRLLQNTKLKEIDHLNDMPPSIPMPLVVGSKVTARLRSPYDGIYTGVIEALDTITHSYRITFDRPGIGTYSVPDYEILHDSSQDSLPISSFTLKVQKEKGTPQIGAKSMLSPTSFLDVDSPLGNNPENDPFMGQPVMADILKKEVEEPSADMQNAPLPPELIEKLNEFAKVIDTKQKVLTKHRIIQKEIIESGEYAAFDENLMSRRSRCLYELEVLNSNICPLICSIDKLLYERLPDDVKETATQVLFHQKRYMDKADKIFDRVKGKSIAPNLINQHPQIIEMIKRLSTIQMQMSAFPGRKAQAVEIAALQESLEATKLMLDPTNRVIFETSVEKYVEKTLGIASPEPRKRLTLKQ